MRRNTRRAVLHPDPRRPWLLAILARQKEPVLPLYLRCIESLDYPKERICLYVRTNNNRDRTSEILRQWLSRVDSQYAALWWDDRDLLEPVHEGGDHEWSALRLRVLAGIRQASMSKALEWDCDSYFVADCDNYLAPSALRRLVDLKLPIVAPLLRRVGPPSRYANFHAAVDEHGYFRETAAYDWLLERQLTGINRVPVVHCTYLVQSDVIPALTYDDGSGRLEYVVFSDSARKAHVDQYLDNREFYGCLTLDETPPSIAAARQTMDAHLAPAGRQFLTQPG